MTRSTHIITYTLSIALAVVLLFTGCKHEPLVQPDDITTIGGGGGGGQDPDPPEVICDSTTVFFEQQVLPILISNCAIPGCHNLPTDDNDDIQITSYQSLMNSGIVQDGDFWEDINDTDPDDRMPPPPQSRLTAEQLALISTWLQQGAQNNSCQPGSCDTINVTYSGTIVPIIQQKCQGCHSGTTPQGGLDFTAWGVVNSVANDGRLEAAIQHLPSAEAMPPSGPMLSQCTIDQFLIWIGDGAPNN
ncbi:MAG: hypothetical protein WAR83_09685 [Flavobacteriales bacterium]|nr:hypothetical protein [Flavobacteriales bacterium]